MEDITDETQGNMINYIRQSTKPAMYLCGNCRCPLGDTQNFVDNHVGDSIILLKAVTDQVKLEPRKQASKISNEVGSTYQILRCKGCSSVIGKFYSTTVKHLEYKHNMFGLNWRAIKRYILGSADKQLIPEQEEPITLCKYDLLEQEMRKSRLLLNRLEKKISKLEEEDSDS